MALHPHSVPLGAHLHRRPTIQNLGASKKRKNRVYTTEYVISINNELHRSLIYSNIMTTHLHSSSLIACLLMQINSSNGLSFLAPSLPLSRPIFVPPGTTTQRSFMTMKISKGKSKNSKANSIYAMNQERKRLAGNPGSKHFMDPNKIFIGNLSYDSTVEDLKEFLTTHLGHLQYVESVKIIRDWKTGKSKGYGFVQFIDPIFATSSMEIVKGKKLKGRVIRLDQGKKKGDDEQRILFVKRRQRGKDEDVDEETATIDKALDSVEEVENDESEEDEDFEVSDFDDVGDDVLFAGDYDNDDDDDDDLIDGWYEEVYGSNKWEPLTNEEAEGMNREQRRKAQKLKPKKKLPRKGFGTV